MRCIQQLFPARHTHIHTTTVCAPKPCFTVLPTTHEPPLHCAALVAFPFPCACHVTSTPVSAGAVLLEQWWRPVAHMGVWPGVELLAMPLWCESSQWSSGAAVLVCGVGPARRSTLHGWRDAGQQQVATAGEPKELSREKPMPSAEALGWLAGTQIQAAVWWASTALFLIQPPGRQTELGFRAQALACAKESLF
jgi:hypothetical protein